MISAKDLSRCIDLLADLNVSANTEAKRKLLEIGYILKQELNIVEAWDASQIKQHKSGNREPIDIKKLLEDNTQLFNENKKLQELNLKLKEVIDQRIPMVESKIDEINGVSRVLTETIKKL